MDLLATLNKKISSLATGDHTSGLEATLGHIQVAMGHLTRGQDTPEFSAFTDAIYRTNQAFEGSIKEGYRVLAGKDPSKKTPYQIEEYLEKNRVFRPRVLAQFTNYRQNWRNPSTHDYKLDFDGSEAFLAIASVLAFACVLADEIAEKLAFNEGKLQSADPSRYAELQKGTTSLFDFCKEFFKDYLQSRNVKEFSELPTEHEVIGNLSGVIASNYPEITISSDQLVRGKADYLVDLLLKFSGQVVLVEFKRLSVYEGIFSKAKEVALMMEDIDVDAGILVFYGVSSEEIEIFEPALSERLGRVAVVYSATEFFLESK